MLEGRRCAILGEASVSSTSPTLSGAIWYRLALRLAAGGVSSRSHKDPKVVLR